MSYKPANLAKFSTIQLVCAREWEYIKQQTEQGQFGSCGGCRHDVATLKKGAIWCHLGEKKVPFGAIFGALNLLLKKC